MRRLIALCLVAVAFAGCTSYRLGTGATTGFTTLYIAPVANTTTAPQSVALVTAQIREAFLRDGRVTLVASPAEAEATLTITLTRYQREVLTARPGDTGLGRKFGLDLSAEATLRDNRTGQTIFEKRSVSATRQSFADDGQLQAEYQSLPLLAETLAKNTAHAVLDTW